MRVGQRWSMLTVFLLGSASTAFGQGPVTTVGIAGVRDDTGGSATAEIREKAAVGLQQNLNRFYKDTLAARALDANGDGTVEQLATRGRQDGVTFVVRGGLLALSAGNVQIYADVISVEAGSVTTLRAEGESSDLDAALSVATARLSTAIHDLIVSTAPPASPVVQEAPSGAPASSDYAVNTEEELWQLVAQAEAILGNPSGASTQTLTSLRQAVERLNASLETKAAVVRQGGNAARADQEIAVRMQELQSALAIATEEATTAQEVGASFEEPSTEKKGVLASIAESVGQATTILRQLQDFRAQWNAARADQAATRSGEPPSTEYPFEEITGGVTEDGEPVEGVTVTEPDSGATTTTDSNGSFVLRAVPGKTSTLVLTRKSKQVAMGRVFVQRGRPAVADFELKPRLTSSAGLKVLPSTVLVQRDQSRAGSTGTVAGVVRDSTGRPVARALVTLRGIGVARTDSQGRYAFIGVPAGSKQVTVYRPGLKPQSAKVQVAARQTSQSPINLASSDRNGSRAKPIPTVSDNKVVSKTEPKNPPPTPSRTEPTNPRVTTNKPSTVPAPRSVVGGVRGQVIDAKTGSPVRGAVVSLSGAGGTETNGQGSFSVTNLKAGTYQMVVRRSGYADGRANLTIRAGETVTLNLRLTPRPTMQRKDLFAVGPKGVPYK